MKIWVDIATPPQVLFLRPIMEELERRGYELVITTRRATETIALADAYHLSHTVIGAHGGETFIGKGIAIIVRSLRLIWFLRGRGIKLAVSHSSYSQALAAGLMRWRFVALTDYEGHPGMRLVCRFAEKILVPQVFQKENLFRYGASEDQVEFYNGFKEDVYLSDFEPTLDFLKTLGVSDEHILVTMRPPSEEAAYHQFENTLFDEVLKYVAAHPDTFVVLLPRTAKQRQKYESFNLRNVFMPHGILDGPNLVFYSDLVIGGGGTMNREARVFCTPVYTLFQGELGSVDRYLIDTGQMTRIEIREDITRIKICKRTEKPSIVRQNGHHLIEEIVNKILEVHKIAG
jgi:predicted glycosyltransferase